jgi:hypothetical protein
MIKLKLYYFTKQTEMNTKDRNSRTNTIIRKTRSSWKATICSTDSRPTNLTFKNEFCNLTVKMSKPNYEYLTF